MWIGRFDFNYNIYDYYHVARRRGSSVAVVQSPEMDWLATTDETERHDTPDWKSCIYSVDLRGRHDTVPTFSAIIIT